MACFGCAIVDMWISLYKCLVFAAPNRHMCINMSQNKAKTGDKRSKHALKSPKTRGEITDKWISNGSVAASFCCCLGVVLSIACFGVVL